MGKMKAKYGVKAQAINTGSVVINGSKFGAVEEQSDASSSNEDVRAPPTPRIRTSLPYRAPIPVNPELAPASCVLTPPLEQPDATGCTWKQIGGTEKN